MSYQARVATHQAAAMTFVAIRQRTARRAQPGGSLLALPGVCAQAQPVLAFPRAGRSAAVFVGAAALPGTALSAHVPGTFPRAPAGVGPSTLLPPPARCGTAALASARAQCWPAWPRAVARPGSCAWCGAAAQCRSHFCGAPSAALLLAARLALHPFLSFASRVCVCISCVCSTPPTHSLRQTPTR